MKTSDYALAGDVPQSLAKRVFKFKAAETLDDMRAQVKDNDDAHVVSLAQASLDITRQRLLRSKAGSEDISNILEGKTDESKDLSQEDRVSLAAQKLQEYIDGYIYGSRPAGTGETAKVKAKAKVGDQVLAAAAADPEFAKRMIALGVELPDEIKEQLRAQGHEV